MAEFIEYVKNEYDKQNPKKYPYVRNRPRDDRVDNDSISEITDCEDDGILS